ncbi:putative Late embryogenesis abundant protein, LEA-14 [Rosa chinensis]|uniref:Putative Late embryogenesis abundant protein, LEA-14 n=1 Tax=Rosa chinensis TaxID=74649 RepID=A0A2P6P6M9_ROSCH|nr:putative Late embryogenesis abundant protein, LEA-14 [Rosa chinensis]
MAEKDKQAYALANGYTRSNDHESAEATFQYEEELKRQKRRKLFMYIIGTFFVFQIIVITLFALTVMKVKTPGLKLGNIDVQNLNFTSQTPPSFEMTFTTQIRIKNANFGPYKYDSSYVTFLYQGMTLVQVTIPKGKAGGRLTTKIGATVILNSKALPRVSNLGSDLDSGVLKLSSQAKISGKVVLMFVMKKKKSAEMNCTIEVNLATKRVQALECK